MCGICGYLVFNHKACASADTIKRLADVLHHRGPDEYGHYQDRGMGLGFRRLSIIDLVTGSQPMTNEDGSVVIVFNGEIYNYQEIKNPLQGRHLFRTKSDTEVLLHLYEDKQEDMLSSLNGMFAFALWDSKRELLFCARDRAGQKPFYYCIYDGSFIFASEPKAILRFSPKLNEIEPAMISKYLAYEYVPAPQTIYRHIKRLPAGCCLKIKISGDISIKRYWSMYPYVLRPASDKRVSEGHVTNRILGLFKDSVRSQLMSDVPLGVFLSGGIDSSSIVAVMGEFCDSKNIKTFSIGFEDKSFDESSYASIVASYFRTDHKLIMVTQKDMLRVLPNIMRIMDEPFADASIIPTYLLSQFTRQHVTVALSGDGGDELFAGYPTFQAQHISQWLRLCPPQLVKCLLGAIARCMPVSTANLSLDFRLKQFLLGVGYEPEIANQIWLGSFNHEDQKDLFTDELYSIVSKERTYEDVYTHIDEVYRLSAGPRARPIDTIERVLDYYFNFYLQDDILTKVDRASMANSLEVRSPFLDRDFMQYVSSVDHNLKLRGFTTKYIFKKAMRHKLPTYILNRPKKGFGIPVAKWFKNELKDFLTDVLSPERIRSQGFFNNEHVQLLIKEHLRGEKDNRKQLWTLLIFELWYDEYHRNRP